MNIALLNVRIMIQKHMVTTDAVGNHLNTWSDYYECAATVSNESNAEAEYAGTTVDNTSVDFTVRYSSETAVIDSTGYRVLFADQVYNILTVDHMNYKHKAIKLKCRKVRR